MRAMPLELWPGGLRQAAEGLGSFAATVASALGIPEMWVVAGVVLLAVVVGGLLMKAARRMIAVIAAAAVAFWLLWPVVARRL